MRTAEVRTKLEMERELRREAHVFTASKEGEGVAKKVMEDKYALAGLGGAGQDRNDVGVRTGVQGKVWDGDSMVVRGRTLKERVAQWNKIRAHFGLAPLRP